jgi:hypothetical protein
MHIQVPDRFFAKDNGDTLAVSREHHGMEPAAEQAQRTLVKY